jgi:polysaccharide export outer membrane protein
MKSFFLCTLSLSILSVIFSSCGNTRQFTYMQGSFDTARLSQITIADPIVQKGDLISIIVYSDNPGATGLYNQPLVGGGNSSSVSSASGSGSGGSGSTTGVNSSIISPNSPGYLVDMNGNIEFQGLGLLHIESLTKSQIKELLDSKLKDFLKNPYYNIRFLNSKFTILGEVGKPGIYSIPGDHINIFEALGLSGDLTFFAKRDDILIIRENKGKREFARMNILKPEIMASPYFYIQQNDILIIDQTRKKIAATDQTVPRNISIAASLISLFAIIYSIFK